MVGMGNYWPVRDATEGDRRHQILSSHIVSSGHAYLTRFSMGTPAHKKTSYYNKFINQQIHVWHGHVPREEQNMCDCSYDSDSCNLTRKVDEHVEQYDLTQRECHGAYCHGTIKWNKVIFYLGLQMIWQHWSGEINGMYTYWQICTTHKQTITFVTNMEILLSQKSYKITKHMGSADSGDRMINSYSTQVQDM
jgi:hypothetical protein